MPTRDAVAYAILTLLLLFVALNLQAGWVFAVDALLIGFALAGWMTTYGAVRPAPVSRAMPVEVFEGEPVTVTLTVGPVSFPRFFVRVCDAVPGCDPGELFFLYLGRRAVSAQYRTTARRRGVHRVETVELRSEGVTGLFRLRRTVAAPGVLTVFPSYAVLPSVPLPGQTGLELTPFPRPARTGLDVAGVRDFREGDDPSRIHWRSTARRGHPIVREFERDVEPLAALLIDNRPGTADGEAFEALIRAAASVAHFVTHRGAPVRIVTGRDAGVDVVTAGWVDALRALASITPRGDRPPMDLLAALPGGTPVVVFTADADAVVPLAAAGVPVLAIVAEGGSGGAALLLEALGVPSRILRRGAQVGACLAG